jgi:hypothetical protein
VPLFRTRNFIGEHYHSVRSLAVVKDLTLPQTFVKAQNGIHIQTNHQKHLYHYCGNNSCVFLFGVYRCNPNKNFRLLRCYIDLCQLRDRHHHAATHACLF